MGFDNFIGLDEPRVVDKQRRAVVPAKWRHTIDKRVEGAPVSLKKDLVVLGNDHSLWCYIKWEFDQWMEEILDQFDPEDIRIEKILQIPQYDTKIRSGGKILLPHHCREWERVVFGAYGYRLNITNSDEYEPATLPRKADPKYIHL